MNKQLMILGLLLERPMYGQQIREVIELHHEALEQFIKKPIIYYQLERLVKEGYLMVQSESIEAPGPGLAHEAMALREREIYHITESGRHYFYTLLRQALRTFEPQPDDVDLSLFFLHHLNTQEAISLLEERRERVIHLQARVSEQVANTKSHDRAHQIFNSHLFTRFDAELNWLEHTIAFLRTPEASSPEQR